MKGGAVERKGTERLNTALERQKSGHAGGGEEHLRAAFRRVLATAVPIDERTVIPEHHVVKVDFQNRRVETHSLAERVTVHKALSVTEGADEFLVLYACCDW